MAAPTLAWPWLLLAYSLVVPLGCTFIGALLASIPYYVWRGKYPVRAKTYNRHVWIAFAISCVLWVGIYALGSLERIADAWAHAMHLDSRWHTRSAERRRIRVSRQEDSGVVWAWP